MLKLSQKCARQTAPFVPSQATKNCFLGNNAIQTWHYTCHLDHFSAKACYTAELAPIISPSTASCASATKRMCCNLSESLLAFIHRLQSLSLVLKWVFWWNAWFVCLGKLIVCVALCLLAFKILLGTFVIQSSSSMTGRVNRVLLMMLYWFPNWITKQHSITTAQSIQQATLSKQMCLFVICLFDDVQFRILN